MPARVAAVVVAVAIVEILANDAADQAESARVIENGAYGRRMFNRPAKHGAFATVMVRPAPSILDRPLKATRNLGNLRWGEKLGNGEIAEGVEKVDLCLGKLHTYLLRLKFVIVDLVHDLV